MKQGRERVQRILTGADFPGEILTGVPVVELKGSAEAVILNHRGILSYDGAQVRVASSIGTLTVTGENLSIRRMNRERLILHGRIRAVALEAASC